ncbi:ABC transporter permease [Lachnospiraceae bacterium 45-W7]
MNIRILKKDLRRKRSINLILLLFIFLSVTFVAGSLNNFSIIQNGIDEFMEKSQMADYTIMTMGESQHNNSSKDDEIENFLKNQKQVSEYFTDDVLYLTKKQIQRTDGGHVEQNDTIILSSFALKGQKFFSEDNQELTAIEEGSIYLSQKSMLRSRLKKGAQIVISTDNGFRMVFTVEGGFKDAFLGSDMMGSERMLISQSDYEKVRGEGGVPQGKTYSVYCSELEEFETAYNNQGLNVFFGGDKKLIKTSYIMEMVIAAVILSVSVCLIAIALVMLKFTIVFTVNEDYKEIGIMKAIGLQTSAIRKLYTAKYFVLAAAGAFLGFLVSIPFSRLLIGQATQKLVIENSGTDARFQFLVSFVMMLMVTLSAYHSTGKIKKMTPMDAIRKGNNGERFCRKGVLRLQGSRRKPTTFLACNDVASEFRKYLVLAITGMLGLWLVIMPVNTINTLRSDGLLEWFGTQKCDFFIVNSEKTSELMLSGEKQKHYDYMSEIKTVLEQEKIPVENVCTEVFFRLKVRKGDKSFQSFSLQGLNTRMEDYFYDEGSAPVYKNEIAMTHIVAEKIDAAVGDTVYITIEGKEEPYLITALYQSMNNMGQGIRFTEHAELDYTAQAGGFGIQVCLKDGGEDLPAIIERVKKIFPEARVQTVQEFIDHMVGGISQQLDSLKLMILMVVITINILVVVLMQKMFLIREQAELGMLKAIGFSDRDLIAWQTKRIMLVLFAGIVAGALTGNYFSQVTSGKVFQIMGATKIDFVVNPLEIYGIYPLALFLATVTACFITMQRVRRISVQEINNME